MYGHEQQCKSDSRADKAHGRVTLAARGATHRLADRRSWYHVVIVTRAGAESKR